MLDPHTLTLVQELQNTNQCDKKYARGASRPPCLRAQRPSCRRCRSSTLLLQKRKPPRQDEKSDLQSLALPAGAREAIGGGGCAGTSPSGYAVSGMNRCAEIFVYSKSRRERRSKKRFRVPRGARRGAKRLADKPVRAVVVSMGQARHALLPTAASVRHLKMV